MAEAKRVVISGYYGFGNLGDEAILGVLLEELRSLGSRGDLGIEPVVLSAAPRETARLYGVKAVDRSNPREVRRAIRAADAFLSGGGGLLQDETSRRSALYYLGLIAYALRHCPVYLVGQGLGPLRSRLVTRWARSLLPRAAFATVRDEPSAKLLRGWGLPEERLARGSDLALLLAPRGGDCAGPPAPADADAADPEGGRPYVLIALRGTPPEGLAEGLVHQLAYVQRELGLRPVFFALHPPEDREGMEALAARLTPRPPVLRAEGASVAEALCVFRRARAVVGMRLHALIFALLGEVPFLAVGGPTKLETFARQVERAGGPALPCAAPEQVASFEVELAAVLEGFRGEEEALRARLRVARDVLYNQTRRATDALLRRLREDLSASAGTVGEAHPAGERRAKVHVASQSQSQSQPQSRGAR